MHYIYRGLLGTVGTVAREEGASALWKGLEPGAMDASPDSTSFAALKTRDDHDAACLHVSTVATSQKQPRFVQDYIGNACLVG